MREMIIDPDLESFQECRDYHLQNVKDKWAESTYTNKRSSLNAFEEFINQHNIDFSEIETRHIKLWRNWLSETKGHSDLTVRQRIADIKSFYQEISDDFGLDNIADPVDTQHLSNNPKMLEELDEDELYLEDYEYKRVIEAAKNKQAEMVMRCLWNLGVRKSELCEIEIGDTGDDDDDGDFDWENSSVTIDTAKDSNNKSRDVYFSKSFGMRLQSWIDDERYKYRHAEESTYLFPTNNNPQMSPSKVQDIVKENTKDLDFNPVVYITSDGRERHRIHPHLFRVSYAVHRVREPNSLNIAFLQTLMGHDSIESTRWYLRFKEDDIEEADRRCRPNISP